MRLRRAQVAAVDELGCDLREQREGEHVLLALGEVLVLLAVLGKLGLQKVGASVVCARRGGCSATFDELNKYFTISGMPVASSQYWNSIHGRAPGEAEQDGEGRQTMRTLARNMTFLMKSIALGKEQFGLPEKEERIATHFIR